MPAQPTTIDNIPDSSELTGSSTSSSFVPQQFIIANPTTTMNAGDFTANGAAMTDKFVTHSINTTMNYPTTLSEVIYNSSGTSVFPRGYGWNNLPPPDLTSQQLLNETRRSLMEEERIRGYMARLYPSSAVSLPPVEAKTEEKKDSRLEHLEITDRSIEI